MEHRWGFLPRVPVWVGCCIKKSTVDNQALLKAMKDLKPPPIEFPPEANSIHKVYVFSTVHFTAILMRADFGWFMPYQRAGGAVWCIIYSSL